MRIMIILKMMLIIVVYLFFEGNGVVLKIDEIGYLLFI